MFQGILLKSQDSDYSMKKYFDFVNLTKNYQEGYVVNIGRNDFKYHSFRSDINDCLLTRATDGKMAIEWETSRVPGKIQNNGIGYLWMAATDITSIKNSFDLYFNDIKRFVIQSGENYNWSFQGEDGGNLRFFTIETDQHGDAHGYMALWAPESWLIRGERQRIKITGEADRSNTWLIVYKASDAAEFLRESARLNKHLNLEAQKTGNKYKISVTLPENLSGDTLFYSANNDKGFVITVQTDKNALANFDIHDDALGKSFVIKDTQGEIMAVESFGQPGLTSLLLPEAISRNQQKIVDDRRIVIESQRIYNPAMIKSLHVLSGSNISDATIFLMNSSHQDIAWMDSPEKCILLRDTMLLSPLIDLTLRKPEYRFDIEDALMLREYIHRHPDKENIIRQLLVDGQISCGAAYIQPYEEMYSGESLARQFYLGKKWLKDKLNYQADVYWNVDVPGRTLQMPQIMRKAGVDYLMMSRFEKGIYHWYSPDGSFITAFSPGHYADAFTSLQKNFYDAAQYTGSSSLFWNKFYDEKSSQKIIPLLSDWDMSPAVDYSSFIKEWESIKTLSRDRGDFKPVELPKFKIVSGADFFKAIAQTMTNIPEISGERPAVWIYIQGPSHERALKASREADILLTQAEKFATVNSWIDGSFKNYPQDELNNAWKSKVYPDHGWGGKNGNITDQLFLRKYIFARSQGEKILKQTLGNIASKIRVDTSKGIPLVVFNSLSWSRTDVAKTKVTFDKKEASGVTLKDWKNNVLPCQIIQKELYDDGSIRSAEICFIAEKIPSIGYKTYYYSPGRENNMPISEKSQSIENDYYRIEVANGGLRSIYDKELERELIDPSKFNAGEVFTMRSIGNGAGEFADVQQPDTVNFDKTGNYQTQWEIDQNGPVYISLKSQQQIRNAIVVQKIKLYHDIKRIDFNTEIKNWEGVLYREYRFALPLNMENGQVAYEVPYGVLEVGKDEMEGDAGERYIYPCRDTRPRGIQNWIGAYDKNVSIILSSSVAAADFLDPTDQSMHNPLLQLILFASRKSCHVEGNEYLQTGDHTFHFSLTSTRSDWRNGYKAGIEANESLKVTSISRQFLQAGLPEEISFFTIDKPDVIITSIKKADDREGSVIRMVEMEGKDTNVSIKSFMKIHEIDYANLIEEPVPGIVYKPGQRINVGHHAIETYIIK